MRILVIEDDHAVRESIKEILEYEGYTVETAIHGKDGIEKLPGFAPNIILCDIKMPVMDGFETVKTIRKNPDFSSITIVFLTALSDIMVMREGMELGADDFIAKPFTRKVLLKAIQARIDRISSVSERAESKVTDFVKSLSLSIPHELRTPLASIIGYSEYIRKYYDTLDDDDVLDMVSTIALAGARLHETIEKFILYSTLSSDMLNLKNETKETDVSHIKRAVSSVQSKSPQYEARQDDVSNDIEDLSIRISDYHLFKLVDELFSNAAKFSEPGTPIEISAKKDGDYCKFTIRNHGRGMTKEQIKAIGAFTQFDRSKYEQQGIGMGLVIVKMICSISNCELSIDSCQDECTSITVRMPLALK